MQSISHFEQLIARLGDSNLVIEDDDIVKVHVHTNNPGKVLEAALKLGELDSIKIDNMKFQHNETIGATDGPPKEFGIIAVAAGDGLIQAFREMGADHVVSGGQSMNPSTEDILDAVNRVNAETIFILPNNKNIILKTRKSTSWPPSPFPKAWLAWWSTPTQSP
jgi:dihydroxyacetone kinase-like predicted kinase